MHKNDSKKDRFMQVYSLHSLFIPQFITYYCITDLPCSHLRLVTKWHILKQNTAEGQLSKWWDWRNFEPTGENESERSLRSWEGGGGSPTRHGDDASSADFM